MKAKPIILIFPCPHCGRTTRYKGNNKPYIPRGEKTLGNYYVRCGNCWTAGPMFDNEAEAVSAWNALSGPGRKLN